MRMLYRQYKAHYADCQTVPDSYDKVAKSIEVIIPESRMKPSGVRGQRFSGYQFDLIDCNGERGHVCYRAVCEENAEKRFLSDCKAAGWTPIGISKIFR